MGERASENGAAVGAGLVLGMIQYEGDPAVVAQMLAEAPAPVRWIVPRLARRAFRRHALVIHGTADALTGQSEVGPEPGQQPLGPGRPGCEPQPAGARPGRPGRVPRAATGSPAASASRASVCWTEPRKNADRPPAANRSA